MRMLIHRFAGMLLSIFTVGTASANEIQPCDKQSGRQCKILKGVAIDFPAPIWISDGAPFLSNPTNAAEVDIRQTVLYLPPGQTFPDWDRAFSLLGFDFRRQRINGKPVSHLNVAAAHVAEMTKQCAQDRFYSQVLSENGREINLIIFCEAGLRSDDQAGYDAHHGVIGLYSIFSFLGRVLGVSQEWRGARFEVRDRTSWPVPPGELDLMQARLATIRVLGETRRR